MIHAIAAVSTFICGTRAYWNGVGPTSEQRIYFANHSSHLDSIILWAALPRTLREQTRAVAARDYWGSGMKRRLADQMGALLIDRSREGGSDPLAPLDEALDRGSSLIFFPEGTRSLTGEVQPFRSGLFRLAERHPNVVLVPSFLENFDRVLPKGSFVPLPLVGSVVFGAPIQLATNEPKDEFLSRARAAVLNCSGQR